jgi:hypothetical protein
MKKLIFLLVAAFGMIATTTQAQTAVLMPLAAGDTIVDAGTVFKTFAATGNYAGVTVQVNLTKVSGTGAGSVVVQGSLDGSKYTTIGSAYTITNTASQAAFFIVTAPLPPYIKVLCTGSGTEVVGARYRYKFVNY